MIQPRRGRRESSGSIGQGPLSAAHRYQLASDPRDLKMLSHPVPVQFSTQWLLSTAQISPFTSSLYNKLCHCNIFPALLCPQVPSLCSCICQLSGGGSLFFYTETVALDFQPRVPQCCCSTQQSLQEQKTSCLENEKGREKCSIVLNLK